MELWKLSLMDNQVKKLRQGYTTGACASAGALAAYITLCRNKKSESVSLLLPAGTKLEIPVDSINKNMATIIKDAGDDPDVTDKMKICVAVKHSSKSDINEEDYLEKCAKGFIIIKGGAGVGLVTRPGLDVAVGKWAVNPGPRKMIVDNLKSAGFGKKPEYLSVEISALNGAEIAQKTLNPTLGVVGGISILGTSGIVEPYSNAAYIRTIELRVSCAAEEGVKEIAFTTGSRSRNAILRDRPGLNDETCIRIGDFIADSLKAVSAAKIKTVFVACMPGKLYKYACGYEYTHAHKVKLKPDLMLEELASLGVERIVLAKVAKCDTVGEAASMLEQKIYNYMLEKFADKALVNLKKWAAGVNVNLYVYSSGGKLILNRIAS